MGPWYKSLDYAALNDISFPSFPFYNWKSTIKELIFPIDMRQKLQRMTLLPGKHPPMPRRAMTAQNQATPFPPTRLNQRVKTDLEMCFQDLGYTEAEDEVISAVWVSLGYNIIRCSWED